MKTPEEVQKFLLAKAHEIFDEGFRDGYEHGLLTFGKVLSLYDSPAHAATHVEGTEAPEGESWEQMQQREAFAGATLKKIR